MLALIIDYNLITVSLGARYVYVYTFPSRGSHPTSRNQQLPQAQASED